MPLGELNDEQMDHLLREMGPSTSRSPAWEKAERVQLLRHIGGGDASADMAAFDTPVEHRLLDMARPAGRTRARRWLVPASVAAAVVLGLGLMAIERQPQEPSPADQPLVTSGSVLPSVLPALPADAPLPDRFPIVAESWPGADTAIGTWGGQIGWENDAMTEALVARRDASSLRDGIAITLGGSGPEAMGAPQQATVAGQLVDLYVENGTPALTTVVLPGSPVLTVSGRDPIAFLEAAGGFPIVNQRVDPDGTIMFDVGILPADYETIVTPTPLPLGAIEASTQVPMVDGDGLITYVSPRNPLISWAQATDFQPVDVNGITGWADDRGPGSTVIWQLSDTTWALVGAAPDAATALEFARAIDFVDQATWSTRYNVEIRQYQTQQQSSPTNDPPPPPAD